MVDDITALILLTPAVFGISVLALAIAVFALRRRPAPAATAEPKLESAAWSGSAPSRSSGLMPNRALATSSSSRSLSAG